MNRQNIMRRLRDLRNLEFVNIFLLPACLFFVLTFLQVQRWQPYAFSMFIVCVILAQGVFYWHLKLQAIRKNEVRLPSYFYRTFLFFKRMNVFLLLLYPVLVLCTYMNVVANFRVSIWSSLLFLFAVLEYINYYHYQLSHDNLNDIRYLLKHKKIRRSPLYMDMSRSRQALW